LNDTVQLSPINAALRSRICLCAIACLVGFLAPTLSAPAAQIDVSLNLFYNNTGDPTSGGTWTLAAKTDESGLLSLNVFLQGIASGPTDITLVAPRGAVNTSENAGFFHVHSVVPAYTSVAVAQAPTRDGQGDETVFYGVGSILDPQGGAPNYPGQPAGTTSIGPVLSTLTNVQNGVWGNGDALGDPDWAHAAVLLSGTFLPGSTPRFFTTDELKPSGRVFLDTGTPGHAGTASLASQTTVTTVVRSDLEFRGDYNGDGVVDSRDYIVWRNTTGQAVPPYSGADGTGDGQVNVLDYIVWKNYYGLSAPGAGSLQVPISPVPEPQIAVLATFMVGFASAALRWQRNGLKGQARNFENLNNPGETA
jgi:hypothetical protein